jgi:hypothetical protein
VNNELTTATTATTPSKRRAQAGGKLCSETPVMIVSVLFYRQKYICTTLRILAVLPSSCRIYSLCVYRTKNSIHALHLCVSYECNIKQWLFLCNESRDSDGLCAGRPGFGSQQWKIFLISTASRPTLGPTQPPIQWIPENLSLGIKRQGCEADHSPPSSAEVEKDGDIPPLPHISPWHSAS